MSKITNNSLTRSGTGCCAHMATVGVKGLTRALHLHVFLCNESCTACLRPTEVGLSHSYFKFMYVFKIKRA